MSSAIALVCSKCGKDFSLAPISGCESCLAPLEVRYDYKAMAALVNREKLSCGPTNMWRYRDFLPIESEPVDIGTGFTPLIKANNLGRCLGLHNFYVKNDCLNPSYSFKDRVVSVAITKAREFGFEAVACASTGNLAASVAAHAASVGMKAYVFVPADVEPGKLVGAAVYNPILVTVSGNYDQVNRLCRDLMKRFCWGFI